MANIKSAIKRAKLAAEKTARNKSIKSGVRTAVKKFEAAAAGDPATAVESLRKASSALDKAVTKGVIHRNAADRKKSRLARKLNAKSSQ
ncbi:MAG: 30S ribosomal protein S20 [Ignavibacteriales bacterium]